MGLKEKDLEKSVIESLKENGYCYDAKIKPFKDLGLIQEDLLTFLKNTQTESYEELELDNPNKIKNFLETLQQEIKKNGVINCLKKGLEHPKAFSKIILFKLGIENMPKNIFRVCNQVVLNDRDESIDLMLCVNGIPLFSIEVKNHYTGQNVFDAKKQYQQRDPKTPLLAQCGVHFALDNDKIYFCTFLERENSVFLPFNDKNEKTSAFFYEKTLKRENISNLLENYLHYDKNKRLVFPRLHQLRVVEKLVEKIKQGLGKNYLIQHSAGSGKSHSITWLAFKLIKIVDCVLIVTDRKILDAQLKENVRHYSNSLHLYEHVNNAKELKECLLKNTQIIATTLQKFSFVGLEEKLYSKSFCVLIDEAHSSQSGEHNQNLQDVINNFSHLKQVSYIAFSATPKETTIEMFGTRNDENKLAPFDSYSMSQAIEEGFILDVLQNYTEIKTYYEVSKTIEDNPKFNPTRAKAQMRRIVEGSKEAIERKSKIIVEDFLKKRSKGLNSQARAMVVTESIDRAIKLYKRIKDLLKNSPYKALVAFSGSYENEENNYESENSLNGFKSEEIAKKFKKEPYRILVVANKFQTGFDEPLLTTMYVDKKLDKVNCVQTLSRLNRCYKNKHEVFILDFANTKEDIKKAFEPYYTSELFLKKESDISVLNNRLERLEKHRLYDEKLVNEALEYIKNPNCNIKKVDELLNPCIERYKSLDSSKQDEITQCIKSYIKYFSYFHCLIRIENIKQHKMYKFLKILDKKLKVQRAIDYEDLKSCIEVDYYNPEIKAQESILLSSQPQGLKAKNANIKERALNPKEYLDTLIQDFNEQHRDGNQDIISDDLKDEILKIAQEIAKNDAIKNTHKNNIDISSMVLEKLKKQWSMDLENQYYNNSSFKEWIHSKLPVLVMRHFSSTN
ncbi:type I restriction endonuclease subunit R [Helicobacter cetorum]|uniref:Helicase ATP-binding domain-containing protein n=1 Tax=Helicobacter cetorum (strain ATCC BAA-540 / CCUG 52418 / MIT 99-5656) TaxID=1163745 RepID=I0ESP1_HELCM|nr:DEAD/DEAH box helicase family protein [Helicobacter cetorum]AFI05960.1 hypothetical protein HCD_04780 [Helicobacter cetorum MIT 99-5656]